MAYTYHQLKEKTIQELREIAKDWRHLTDRGFAPERQHGWLICGLHPGDGLTLVEAAEGLLLYVHGSDLIARGFDVRK